MRVRIAASLLVLAVLSCPAAWAQQYLAEVQLAKVPDLNERWGKVVKDGGHDAFGAVWRNRLVVPAWWKDSQYPPEPVYAVEVTFKDTGRLFLRSQTFVGPEWGSQALGSVGGLNDAAWKTQTVYIGQYEFSADADPTPLLLFTAEDDKKPILVEGVKVRVARPEEQAASHAAMRAECLRLEKAALVVKQATQEVRPQPAKPAAAAKPATPPGGFAPSDAQKQLGAVVWAADPTALVYPLDAPAPDLLGKPVVVALAQNEAEGAVFAVHALKDLKNVAYTVSDLTGPAGKLAARVDCLAADLAFAISKENKTQFYRYPCRYWPAFAQDVPAGESRMFCVDLTTEAKSAKPGTYKGTIAVSFDGGKAALPLEVTVLPVVLPDSRDAGVRLGFFCDFMPYRTQAEFLRAHNVNMHSVWANCCCPRPAKWADGKLTVDFTVTDRVMEWLKEAGFSGPIAYFMGGSPQGNSIAGFIPNLYVEVMLHRVVTGRIDNTSMYNKMSPVPERKQVATHIREAYQQWIKAVNDHRKEKGWPEIMVTPFDEPQKWAGHPDLVMVRDHFLDAAKLIRQAAPDLPILGDIHHYKNGFDVFIDCIDVYNTNALFENYTVGEQVLAKGKRFHMYGSARPEGAPGNQRYQVGLYPWSWDASGFWLWAMGEWSPALPLAECVNLGYTAAYRTAWSMIPCIPLKGDRQGINDLRYIRLLEQLASKAKDAKALALLKDVKQASRTKRGEGGRNTLDGFFVSASDPAYAGKVRAEIVTEILRLEGK